MRKVIVFTLTLLTAILSASALDRYTVASFNILGGDVKNPDTKERAEMGRDIAMFCDFDIFGVQEMRRPQAEIYAEGGVYQIAGEVVAPNIEVPQWQRWGNFIFFKKDKFNLLKEGHFWLSTTPDSPSIGWTEKQYRICNYVKLEDRQSGRQIYFFNLHQGLTSDARLKAMQVIKKKIAEIVEDDSTVFLTGDFNADCSEESIKNLLADGFFIDTWLKSATKPFGPKGTFCKANHDKPLCDGNSKTENKIDYIFATKNVSVLKCGVLTFNVDNKYPSDHLPIMAVVEIK